MEIHQIRYFCAVARHGSFTRAAAAEGVTQPSLSQQIVKLEKEFGSLLFERLGRRVRLTDCGEALLPRAEEILRQWNEVPAVLNSVREGVGGQLRIGCIPTIMPYFLAPRIGEFSIAFPEVDITLTEDKTDGLVGQLLAGELDLAIVSPPVSNPEIVCSDLFREPIRIAVSRRHPWAGAGNISLSELSGERLLLLREGHCFRENALTVCSRSRTGFSAVFETDQFSSIFALVRGGFGISLVPQMAATPESGCDFLAFDREAVRRIGYVRARHHVVAPSQKAFTKWLRSIS